MDAEAFRQRWQVWQPSPAMLFDSAGRRDTDGFPIALLNLANRVGRKLWGADVKTAPPSELTLLLSDQRPWAHGSALARCAILTAAGGAVDVYASSEAALDEVSTMLAGLSWRAITLRDPDPDAAARACAQCVTALTCPGAEPSDPGDVEGRRAITEILTAIGVGGHA